MPIVARTHLGLSKIHSAAFKHERSWSQVEFENLCAQPSTCLISDPHCFALGRVVDDELEVLSVACAPSHQRQGRGRTILEAMLKESIVRGAKWAFLEVAADNIPALQLYKSLGFARVGLRKNYYTRSGLSKCDANILQKSLIRPK